MGDQHLSAPAECSSVQEPQQVHKPLFDDFVKAVQANGNKLTINNEALYFKSAEVVAQDGTRFEASFRNRTGNNLKDKTAAKELTLFEIKSSKNDQRDLYDLDWSTSKNWEPKEKEIELEGQLPDQPTRYLEEGSFKGLNGSVHFTANLSKQEGTVRSQRGTVLDLSGNQISNFVYTFAPDGKATMCAKSLTTDGKSDHIVWSLKVE